GHHLDSARPGQPGNMVLTGHVSVADPDNLAVFSTLDNVQPGDVVDVYAGERLYQYRVTDIRVVSPNATRLLRSDHRSLVTLITCTHDLRHRLVVTGELI
ncbi:MAG: sortase, partial [Hyphomicrobiales bacterium]